MKFDKILKAYVLEKAVKEALKASKAAKKGFRNIDWEEGLHKVGLASYKPGKATASGVGLLVAGAVIGGAVALMLAPKKGAELRTDLMGKLRQAESNGFSAKSSSMLDNSANTMPM